MGERARLCGVAEGFQKVKGLRVEVEKVRFMPELEAPKDRPYPFVYFISIINDSDQVVRISGRKWVLKDRDGDTVIVEGEGVVGEKPQLGPGERFNYRSYHVVKSETEVTGSFFGNDAKGERVSVSIPGFLLKVPDGP